MRFEALPYGFGVNFIGDLRTDVGVGEAARSTYRALQTAGVPLSYVELPLMFGVQQAQTPFNANAQTGFKYHINLLYVNALSTDHALKTLGGDFLKRRYNIAVWFWELEVFPVEWHRFLDYFDEIWVASSFTQNALKAVASIPITYIPLSINVETTLVERSEFHLPENRFIFLNSFSPASSIQRKNPFDLITAYSEAFSSAPAHTAPLLVIKTHHADTLEKGRQFIDDLQIRLAEIGGVLITENFSRQQMNNLLNVCDCYISLHRSEGFGLSLAEAMFLGKPVIATDYSGNKDFMNPDNSFLVPYELDVIREDAHIYQPNFREVYATGQNWAQPNVTAAARWMQWVVNRREDVQHRSILGAEAIKSNFNDQIIGERMLQRLMEIFRTKTKARLSIGRLVDSFRRITSAL